jgi:hypothetical protein
MVSVACVLMELAVVIDTLSFRLFGKEDVDYRQISAQPTNPPVAPPGSGPTPVPQVVTSAGQAVPLHMLPPQVVMAGPVPISMPVGMQLPVNMLGAPLPWQRPPHVGQGQPAAGWAQLKAGIPEFRFA